ncbi:hypothetical protein [Nocardioides dongkuii]|uniref:hypothetical protein n=1 Tax=Nocardioides dongkuii TaxID=2760089 RepID=UPI0015FB487C|nr:hypothetical protein [Nocardioides dongkuii]
MRFLLLAPLLVAGLLLPAPAQAAVWTGTDDTGDVVGTTYDPEPLPCGTVTRHDGSARTHGDLVRVRVRHGRDRLRITTRYADLRPGRALTVAHEVRTPGRDFVAGVMTSPGRRPSTWWYDAAAESTDSCGITSGTIIGGGGVTCPSLREAVSLRRDRVRLTIPRDCLEAPRWVRVDAFAGHEADAVWYGDRWGEPGGRWSPRLRPGRP